MIQGISAHPHQNPYLMAQGAQRVARAAGARTIPAARPGTPVQPVEPAARPDAAAAVAGGAQQLLRWQADPAALAVRGRIRYPAQEEIGWLRAAATGRQDGPAAAGGTKTPREVMEEGECQTCKERRYRDGSDDPGVSFKTAAHIDPQQAAAVVRGHEQQHVTREQAAAARQGRQVVSQSVSYRTAICPECGRAYISGGTTRTVTAAGGQEEKGAPLQPEKRQGPGEAATPQTAA